MEIDLREYVGPIVEQIQRHVSEYSTSKHAGPGPTGCLIQQIVLGFQFDQSAWVSLVFDTRADADLVYDGEWQSFIEENTLDCDVSSWMDAYEQICENGAEISFTTVDGKSVVVGPDMDGDEDDNGLMIKLSTLFGSVCCEAMIAAREKSVFSMLPLADTIYLRVDEHECQYAWPDYDSRGSKNDGGRVSRK
jgi:hypothetical protein